MAMEIPWGAPPSLLPGDISAGMQRLAQFDEQLRAQREARQDTILALGKADKALEELDHALGARDIEKAKRASAKAREHLEHVKRHHKAAEQAGISLGGLVRQFGNWIRRVDL